VMEQVISFFLTTLLIQLYRPLQNDRINVVIKEIITDMATSLH
jgi:hypothetical protein